MPASTAPAAALKVRAGGPRQTYDGLSGKTGSTKEASVRLGTRLACVAVTVTASALLLSAQCHAQSADRLPTVLSGIPYSRCPIQRSFYVSPDGDDANPGTLGAPLSTVHKALRATAAAIGSGMTGDIVINFRGGRYRLETPLIFGSAESGRNGCKLVLQSYPGEQASIDGGRRISGWVLDDNERHIYRAYTGRDWNYRQLYVNGRLTPRARMDLHQGNLSRTSNGFVASRSSATAWESLTDAEIVMLGKWMSIRCPITSATANAITIAEPCWKNARWARRWGATHPSWIENSRQFLHNPGEWFFDRNSGYVYYIPKPNEDIFTAEVTAPFTEDLIFGEDAHDIIFRDLKFTHSNWVAPDTPNGYVGLQAGYHIVGGDGTLAEMHSAIRFSDSRDIIFEGNLFKGLGSAALTFDHGSHHIYILGNRFVQIAGGAMQFGQIDDGAEVNPAKQNRSYFIRDNYIRDIGLEYFDNAAIAGFYVADLVAEHNDIESVPHYGISIGWGWGKDPSYSRGNRIAWNYIHDFSQVFSDSAAVYTLSEAPNTLINDNYISGGGRGYGCLYPDEGSAYQHWTRNVCENVREWLHLWTTSIHDNKINGNFVDTADMEDEGRDNDISNNIIVSAGNWPSAALRIKAQAGPQSPAGRAIGPP